MMNILSLRSTSIVILSIMEIEYILPKEERDYLAELKEWFYNPFTNKVMGRDGIQWIKTGLFYFSFYFSLAVFYLCLIGILYAIIDKRRPTYVNRDSLMKGENRSLFTMNTPNPGMGFRPQVKVLESLIRFKQMSVHSNDNGWKKYVDNMIQFLNRYEPDHQQTSAADVTDCVNKKEVQHDRLEGQSCRFDVSILYNQDKNQECSKVGSYGYMNGRPCVIVKLNKVYDWYPIAYSSKDEVPYEVRDHWSEERKNFILVKCFGQHPVDRDMIKRLVYFSMLNDENVGGIPFHYYPYRNEVGYQQPLVLVKLEMIESNILVNIICKSYAKNIDQERELYWRGMVRFAVMIEGSSSANQIPHSQAFSSLNFGTIGGIKNSPIFLDEIMFFRILLKHEVLLHPMYFGADILEKVREKLMVEVEGTCSGKFGYIIAVTSIEKIGAGKIQPSRGFVVYPVKYKAIVFRPFKGEVFDGVVTQLNKVGIFVDIGPFQCFISRHNIPPEMDFNCESNPPTYKSKEDDTSIKQSDVIRVRIIGSRIDATEIAAIGSIMADHLGAFE
ncbi:hypothetical protein SNEBB_001960 [Seison nebaliae]|nr:hypothetical protein SNEBB_001960 [Seison nebaliae]